MTWEEANNQGLPIKLKKEWIKCTNAIPGHWKLWARELKNKIKSSDQWIPENKALGPTYQGKRMPWDKMTQKKYHELNLQDDPITCAKGWKSKLEEVGISEERWKEGFKMVTKLSINSKHRSFIFKQLYNLNYGNKILTKANIKNNEICTYCDTIQTTEHLFHECTVTQEFKTQVLQEVLPPNEVANLTKDRILFITGISGPINETGSLNFLASCINRHIYEENLAEKQPTLSGFKNFLYETFKLEAALCNTEKRTRIHLSKYAKINKLLL